MAQHKEQQSQPQQQQQSKKTTSQAATDKVESNYKSPMIIERVNKIPMVNLAISMGFSQYDKLKSSNVTIGDIMTKAEGWALYVWQKAQPLVEKLQQPIQKADQIACDTFDYVETKISSVKSPLAKTQEAQ